MVINKEWEEVLTEVLNMLGTDIADMWIINIPPHIFNPITPDYKKKYDAHIYYLSTHFIEIYAQGKYKYELKIMFGPERKFFPEKNTVILEFEYAPDIVQYLLTVITHKEILLKTNENLFERESIFSQPFSTFNSFDQRDN